ncbi:hypothetical protein Skr01_57590 [Sphaerisporangium krabiense]|uniref:8-oxo-dGTP pyrophosphatase MutT (NUDIX family) n=1 Tax=Sphaerisporangium krabiense TaxID=763782 RepID=A0A7W8Z8U2_9ACTN|nr:NUDIX domain-containing protein [Sphaerisporangium krabiense]MBB5629475.1 8-oxo-dGTP pyrophosphatase MutT (NUDIX family) [Sphaerisporangium krabiense]GII65674.1 hypothetical protein Skr01_57590 [Sphaerisporangium krabiense]
MSAAAHTTLAEVLGGYAPASQSETAELRRVRALASGENAWDRSTPLHLTASALIVHPPTRRVLLRWHPRQRAWLQVGGHADPHEELPLAIALREGAEETGLADLAPWPDAALVHLVIVPVAAGAAEPAHEHADLRFVLATATPEAVRPENPEARLRWASVAEARELTTEDNLRETLARVGRLLERRSPYVNAADNA